jgi:ABC-type microcin C transport system permease subunit YejE
LMCFDIALMAALMRALIGALLGVWMGALSFNRDLMGVRMSA